MIKYGRKTIYRRRLYTLRKFFRTNLEATGAPYEVVEAFLGHKNYYVRFSMEQLRRYYEKRMWALIVFMGVSESMVAELVEASIKPLREELEKLRLEMEKKELEKEKEFREVMDRLYRLRLNLIDKLLILCDKPSDDFLDHLDHTHSYHVALGRRPRVAITGFWKPSECNYAV